MNYKFTHDKVAVVNPTVKWMPITAITPINSRMLLIDKKQNITYVRTHLKGDGFTHWFPLPTFEE